MNQHDWVHYKFCGNSVISMTEAEYMALSEDVHAIKFIVQILRSMEMAVQLPITVYVDNMGAIFLKTIRIQVIKQNTLMFYLV